MISTFQPIREVFKQYYISKGYCTQSDLTSNLTSIRDNLDYQKTVYAFDMCGIKSIMPEMHLESTGYGADGFTNNSTYGIKCYVAQIRALIMAYINASSKPCYKLDGFKSTRFHRRYV